MAVSWIERVVVAYRRRNKWAVVRRRHTREVPFSTRQGLLLLFAIGTFVALVFMLALHLMSIN